MNRLLEFFVLRRSMVGLLAMVILVAMGEKMGERFLPLYLVALGGGNLALGLLGYLDNQLSAIYSFFGGYIGERLGMKRALRLFNFMAMAGYALIIAVPSWPTAIIGAMLFISWTAISLPATMDLVSGVAPKNKRAMGVSMHSMVKRIPMALGPLLGGVCIDQWGRDTGMRIAFAVALAMTVLALVLQERLVHEPEARPRGKAELNPFKLLPLMNGDLRNLLVSDILVRFCEQIPAVFVVVWCCDLIANNVTATEFGLLTTIEMATADPLRPRRILGRPPRQETLCRDDLRILHALPRCAPLQPILLAARGSIRRSRPERIRRTHAKGPHHGFSPRRPKSRRLRPVLSPARHHRSACGRRRRNPLVLLRRR